jgi:hypothetical protein
LLAASGFIANELGRPYTLHGDPAIWWGGLILAIGTLLVLASFVDRR